MKSCILFLAFGVMSACREAPSSAPLDLDYLRSLAGLPCAVALQQRGDRYYLTETANATYGVFVQQDTVVIAVSNEGSCHVAAVAVKNQ